MLVINPQFTRVPVLSTGGRGYHIHGWVQSAIARRIVHIALRLMEEYHIPRVSSSSWEEISLVIETRLYLPTRRGGWEGLDIFSLRGGLSARAGVVGRPDNNGIVLCLKADALSVRGQRYHHLKGYI